MERLWVISATITTILDVFFSSAKIGTKIIFKHQREIVYSLLSKIHCCKNIPQSEVYLQQNLSYSMIHMHSQIAKKDETSAINNRNNWFVHDFPPS